MKKIIDGRRYDTERATFIAEYEAPYSVTDLHYYTEKLYKKRTGEYFLHVEGRAASKYAKQVEQDRWGSGEAIVPLSFDGAIKWAEEHMTAEAYEAEFGAIEDDDTRMTVHLSLNAAGVERAKRVAASHDISLSALVDDFFATL